jgi:hypothetical protein
MNYPHRASEDITDPPALLFRVTDRLRLEGCVTAMVQDAMSLALISVHEGALDHYGKLLVHRLRAAAPEITLEVYFPASVEALLARFNEALRDHSVADAMQGTVQNAAPKIWILHDAGALPDHEIELLARLIEHFPGANIRVLLLLTAHSNKHHLLNPFGRRILRWEIEPPTPEQAEAMLNQARSEGREGEALSLLQSTPVAQADKGSAQAVPQTPPQSSTTSGVKSGAKGKKYGRLAAAVAALLVASTGAAFFLHSGAWKTVADRVANMVPITPTKATAEVTAEVPASALATLPASLPVEAASASSGVATSVQAVVTKRDAVEEIIAYSTQGLNGTDWLEQQPAEAYIIQHVTEPSYQAANKWVKENSNLQDTHIIPMYLADHSAIEFTVVSGPFSSLRKASKFQKNTASAKGSQIYTVNFLKEKSAAAIAPAANPERKVDNR